MDTGNFKKVPIEGYTHIYQHDWGDALGRHHTEFAHGVVCETMEELNNLAWCYEYDKVAYKHIGLAKVKIELLDK